MTLERFFDRWIGYSVLAVLAFQVLADTSGVPDRRWVVWLGLAVGLVLTAASARFEPRSPK